MGACVPILNNLVNWARFAVTLTHQKYQFSPYFNILCKLLTNLISMVVIFNNFILNGSRVLNLIKLVKWAHFALTKTHQKYEFFPYFNILCQ